MTRLKWDNNPYEVGLDRGVYYPPGGTGVAWNGLTNVEESPSEGEKLSQTVDGVKIYVRTRVGEYAGSITAFTCPDIFFENALAQRKRNNFGMCYRVSGPSSYKIHIIYNILLSSTSVGHVQLDPNALSWDFTTTPLPVPGLRATAHLIIDTETAYPAAVAAIEAILYGDDSNDPQLPSPMEIEDIFDLHAVLRITDNGDGTWTAEGPDTVISMLNATTFQIDWESAQLISSNTYEIRSW